MKRNDIYLILALLLFALLSFGCYRILHLQTGDMVQIAIDGVVTETLPLDIDTTYTIQTEDGVNILQIKDGAACILSADCPDQLCVSQQKISSSGETLVCLPHKVVVSVLSSKKATLDGVAQ